VIAYRATLDVPQQTVWKLSGWLAAHRRAVGTRQGRRAATCGRPTSGGRGNYVSFPVPDDPELVTLIGDAAKRAGSLWAAHRGVR
jgi:hypothetical protein